MRVLVFGDSITQGYWAVEHGWVDRVRKYYDQLQVEDLEGRDEPTVFNLGISADNSSDVLNRIEAELMARTRPTHTTKPIVILQIGVNDSSSTSGAPQVMPEEYASNLESIIAKVAPISSRLIFIGSASCDEELTTPVAWGEYHYTNEAIKTYEDIMSDVAAKSGIEFIPVFDVFKQHADAGNILLADGLHPNEDGHKTLYEIVMPKLRELLV